MTWILLGLVVFGPWQLATTVARAASCAGKARSELTTVVFAWLMWVAVTATLATFLGAAGLLNWRCAALGEVALAACGVVVWRAPRPIAPAQESSTSWSGLLMLLVPLFVLVGEAARALSLPMTNYDSLAYHLPLLAKWIVSQRFVSLEQFDYRYLAALPSPDLADAVVSGQISRYPFVWEAVASMFALSDRSLALATLPNIAAAGALVLAIAAFAEELGGDTAFALVAAALVSTLPIVRDQIASLHVDLAFGTVFVVTLLAARLAAQQRSLICGALVAVGIALLLGIKATGAAYAGLVLVYGAGCRLVKGRSGLAETVKSPSTSVCVAAAILATGTVLAASWWYLRNASETGNPFGYVRLSLLGHQVFPGPIDPGFLRTTTVAHLFHVDGDDTRTVASALWAELGPSGVFLGGGALVFAARALGTRRADQYALSIVVVAATVLYALSPYSGDNGTHGFRLTLWIGQGVRYGFCAIFAAGAMTGSLRIVSARWRTLAIGGALSAALASLGPAFGVLGLSATLAILVSPRIYSIVCSFAQKRLRIVRAERWAVAVTALLSAAGLLLSRTAQAGRSGTYGPIATFVDDGLQAGSPIGYVWSHRSGVFFGEHLQHDVVFVPTHEATAEDWVRALDSRNLAYVATGPAYPAWLAKNEVRWLRERTDLFAPVVEQEGPGGYAAVFRVLGR